MMSLLYDTAGTDINYMEAMNRRCTCQAVIRFESVYVGNRIAVQVRVHEAQLAWHDTTQKRLLPLSSMPAAAPAPVAEPEDLPSDLEDNGRPHGPGGSASDSDDEPLATGVGPVAPVAPVVHVAPVAPVAVPASAAAEQVSKGRKRAAGK